MDCSRFEELIDSYLDNELSEPYLNEFEKHMSCCVSCSKSLEFSKQIRSTMQSLPSISPPKNFSEMLNKRLDREMAEERKIQKIFHFYPKHYGVAAACLLLAVSLGINYSDFFGQAPSVEQALIDNSDIGDTVADSNDNGNISSDFNADISDNSDNTSVSVPEVQGSSSSEAPESVSKAQLMPALTADRKNIAQSIPASIKKTASVNTAVPTAEPNKIQQISKSENISSEPAAPAETPEAVKEAKKKIDDNIYTGRTVIASSVENGVTIDKSSVDKMADEIEYRKSYTLLKEVAENKSIASVSTMEQLKNVKIENNAVIMDLHHDGESSTGAVGNSLIVYNGDASKINEILNRYYTRACGEFYIISDTEYREFIQDLKVNGIGFSKSEPMKSSSHDIMFKLVIA